MKLCKTCHWYQQKPMPVGHVQMAMANLCGHQECCNPVDGEALLCAQVRSNEAFCGLKGRFHVLKKEATKPFDKENVIQLIKS